MDPRPWHQINIAFPDWTDAENAAATHLAPLLAAAEDEGLLAAWFYIRKAPSWRVRYLPIGDASQAHAHLHRRLEALTNAGHIDDVKQVVYEPETHAFGGVEGMQVAHRLFHADSRHLLTYLADARRPPGTDQRRELSILLCGLLLRAARLDWYEQGDVWARVADHRDLPDRVPADRLRSLQDGMRRLMSVDPTSLMRENGPLAFAAEWAHAFTSAGRDLAVLASGGALQRGLRAVLTHHVIFTWNRFGLPFTTQAVLATTAKVVVFGCDPTTTPQAEEESWTPPG
ncbi:thiopeptide-type bacteriocin biosynthesis protein [Sphaerimonospora sp. CA-214678]|uniref:thiopeptide-type bacteriocin biosynthesis protein n=1 Tax=Sphaerimonospora sp. CA-214678 TaxID=3240029 RepID=UPI003D90FD81